MALGPDDPLPFDDNRDLNVPDSFAWQLQRALDQSHGNAYLLEELLSPSPPNRRNPEDTYGHDCNSRELELILWRKGAEGIHFPPIKRMNPLPLSKFELITNVPDTRPEWKEEALPDDRYHCLAPIEEGPSEDGIFCTAPFKCTVMMVNLDYQVPDQQSAALHRPLPTTQQNKLVINHQMPVEQPNPAPLPSMPLVDPTQCFHVEMLETRTMRSLPMTFPPPSRWYPLGERTVYAYIDGRCTPLRISNGRNVGDPWLLTWRKEIVPEPSLVKILQLQEAFSICYQEARRVDRDISLPIRVTLDYLEKYDSLNRLWTIDERAVLFHQNKENEFYTFGFENLNCGS